MPTLWVGELLQQGSPLADGAAVQELLQALMDCYNHCNEQRLAGAPAVPLPHEAIDAADDPGWALFAAGFVHFAEQLAPTAWRAALTGGKQAPITALRQLAARAPAQGEQRVSDDDGRPLLALAGTQDAALDLLRHAMQPLWELARPGR